MSLSFDLDRQILLQVCLLEYGASIILMLELFLKIIEASEYLNHSH